MAMSQQYTQPVNQYTGSYTEDADGDGVRMNAFGHDDADVSFDPLSANRHFAGTANFAVLGTLVFAGPTRESIDVMVPDCIVPPASGAVRVDLRHHISSVPGTCSGYGQLGTGAQYGEGLVSGVSCRHPGTPASPILGRVEPHLEEVEKCKQQQLP